MSKQESDDESGFKLTVDHTSTPNYGNDTQVVCCVYIQKKEDSKSLFPSFLALEVSTGSKTHEKNHAFSDGPTGGLGTGFWI